MGILEAIDAVLLIRHEEARQEAQRAASANRRAALLDRAIKRHGSAAAVARRLGISPAAVTKARANAATRQRPEPLADYTELDLPRTGAAVPLPAEWEAMPPEQQRPAALAAVDHWRALASALHRMATRAEAELGQIGVALVEGDADAERSAASAFGLTRLPYGLADACMHVAADMAETLRAQMLEAHRALELWERRAGIPSPSIHNAD